MASSLAEGGSPFTDHFCCKICSGFLDRPVQCERNEHYYCTVCITEHLARSQTCPVCGETLTTETLRPIPRVVADLLAQVKSPRCEFVQRGCRKNVASQDLLTHRGICNFAPVRCTNQGCEETVNRADLASDLAESCSFRTVKCEECDREIVFRVSDKHTCVFRREMDELKSRLEEMRLLQETVKTNSDFIKQLQDSQRNITPSSLIFVAGGFYRTSSSNSFEVFDWSTQTWTLYENVLFYNHYNSLSFLYKNSIMLCGGSDDNDWKRNRIEYLNIKDDPITSHSFPISLPERGSIPGGKGILCGNRILTFENAQVNEIVLHEPRSSRTILYLDDYRRCYGIERFNENIIIVGGNCKQEKGAEKTSINSVLLYDTRTNQTKQLAPLPYGVSNMATVRYKDNIIILGGEDKSDTHLNSVLMYNITSQECQKLPPMLSKRSGCAAVIMEDVIIVMGGLSQDYSQLNTVEYHVLGQPSWNELPSMHHGRVFATATVVV